MFSSKHTKRQKKKKSWRDKASIRATLRYARDFRHIRSKIKNSRDKCAKDLGMEKNTSFCVLTLKLTLNKTERKKCLVQWALHFQGFCVHRFNQPWINDIWKRNSRKFQKSKT